MRRRPILLLAAAALAAAPALAAEGQPTKDSNFFDMAEVGLPVVIDGRLVNYVFVQVRLMLVPGVDRARLQAKEPYLRDALVRAAHRTPFTVARDPNRLDEAALRRMVAAEAVQLWGARTVTSVEVVKQQPQKLVSAR